MPSSLPPRWHRLVSSLAYSALVATVAALGYLTYHAVREHRGAADGAATPAVEPAANPLVELGGFSARRERSSDAERLAVSLRLRLTAPGPIDCYVYVVARNDQAVPALWDIWPPQGANGAMTAGGHFRSTTPSSGQALHLTAGWARITAVIAHPIGRPPFDTAIVYVVNAKGEILVAHPFAL